MLNCTPFVRQYGILFRKWGAVQHRCSGSFILILGSGRSGDASGSFVQLCAGGAPAAFFYCSIGFIVGSLTDDDSQVFTRAYKPLFVRDKKASFFATLYNCL